MAVLVGLVGLAGVIMWQSSGDSDDAATSDVEGATGTNPPPRSAPDPTVPPTTVNRTPAAGTLVYFAEGSMFDSFDEDLDEDLDEGALTGVRGTIPAAEVSYDFLGQMEDLDPNLPATSFGPETYDAVVLLALAAESAGTDQADEVARHMNAVTNGDAECSGFEECKDLLEAGDDIRYEGQTGALELARPGERTVAEFGIYGWNDDNTVDILDPEFRSVELGAEVPAGTSPELAALFEEGDAEPACTAAPGDGVLSIGGLLVESGDLGHILGAAQVVGAQLAVDDINDAGGVLGRDVEFTQTDGAEADLAEPAVDEHIQVGVDAILGPSLSQVTFDVLDTVVASCTIMVGPSPTNPSLAIYDDDDLYFRTSPSDVLQGLMLADLAVADGAETLVIMARDDDYGRLLMEAAQVRFEARGGEVLETVLYDPEAPDFTTETDLVVGADADAFVLVSFQEGAQVMEDAFAAGLTIGGS